MSDAGSVECSEETKKVYVVAQTKALFRFDPAASTFTRVGTLACPTSATVYSMAVDRRGTAWVLFADGNIFHVGTTDAACSTTPYQPGQQSFTTFGMAFVSMGRRLLALHRRPQPEPPCLGHAVFLLDRHRPKDVHGRARHEFSDRRRPRLHLRSDDPPALTPDRCLGNDRVRDRGDTGRGESPSVAKPPTKTP